MVVHAEINFGDGRLQIGAVDPECGLVAMLEGDGDCYSLGLSCDVVDRVMSRAIDQGATVGKEVTRFVSGIASRRPAIRSACSGRW